MMLCPPILTTFTHGRMAKSGVALVALCSDASLSDPATSRRPRSVSVSLSIASVGGVFSVSGMSAVHPFAELEDPQLEHMTLESRGIERPEGRRRPGRDLVQCLLLDRSRQLG